MRISFLARMVVSIISSRVCLISFSTRVSPISDPRTSCAILCSTGMDLCHSNSNMRDCCSTTSGCEMQRMSDRGSPLFGGLFAAIYSLSVTMKFPTVPPKRLISHSLVSCVHSSTFSFVISVMILNLTPLSFISCHLIVSARNSMAIVDAVESKQASNLVVALR